MEIQLKFILRVMQQIFEHSFSFVHLFVNKLYTTAEEHMLDSLFGEKMQKSVS